jgi:hypothetical protein
MLPLASGFGAERLAEPKKLLLRHNCLPLYQAQSPKRLPMISEDKKACSSSSRKVSGLPPTAVFALANPKSPTDRGM